jgi:hypothetical protein
VLFITHYLTDDVLVKVTWIQNSAKLPEACDNRSCINLPISTNINNMTHTFLWYDTFVSNLCLRGPPIFFNQFMNPFSVKLLEVAVTGCPNFVTQIRIHNLSFFTSVGPTTTHSARVNTVITVNKLHTQVNFDWKTPSAVKNTITARCLNRTEGCSAHGSIACKTARKKNSMLDTTTGFQLRSQRRGNRTYQKFSASALPSFHELWRWRHYFLFNPRIWKLNTR